MRRNIDYSEEYERIAQNIGYNYPQIKNRDEFNKAYDKYMEGTSVQSNSHWKQQTWDEFKNFKKVFEDAGGKDYEKDRDLRSKQITDDKGVYLEIGAQRIDKKGIDVTKESKPKREMTINRQQQDYTIIARQKGKTVYARQIQTKKGARIIDRRGRYAKKV